MSWPSGPARLLSVRLQGFKSFAERTHVAFGPGISAVVGPNGSGKSNLADALRWALGEQGRALRTRKSEDVIWAGSERRPALGMADVQLVLDNADGLLPVEFGVVELGRRLFRSGENEYVLNRQKVRLRDLVDLLDAAHLAENAFLFIGQGMVDQALALRPEERRPLFEEVAGVRRHERRRRKAEEQLAESEANLTRVEDVAAELRPQVRRLAAQAEQQTSRRDAGDELAEALLAVAHVRWHAAARRLAAADVLLRGGRAGLDDAMAELADRERAASQMAERLGASAAAAASVRSVLDEARDVLTAARIRAGQQQAEAEATGRDRTRLEAERTALEAQLSTDRRAAAVTVHRADPGLEHELREADAALTTAVRQLGETRTSTIAATAERESLQRAEAARVADLDLARRRVVELEREAAEEGARVANALATRDAAAAAHAKAVAALERSTNDETQARAAEDDAGSRVAAATAAAADSTRARAGIAARHAAAQGRLAAVTETIAAVEGDGLGAAARAVGGNRIDEGLVIEPSLRAAVAAALGELAAGFVVADAQVRPLASERGSLVVREAIAGRAADAVAAAGGADAQASAAIQAAGGGLLAAAIQADPTGAVRAILARAGWLPDLDACLRLQGLLPPGWLVVARDGHAVVRGPVVMLGASDEILERRAEADRLAAAVRELETLEATSSEAVAALETGATAAAHALQTARAEREAATEARRAAEGEEGAASRRAETAAREAAWLEAQAARAAVALERASATLAALAQTTSDAVAAAPSDTSPPAPARGGSSGTPSVELIAALERRVADLRATRDRLDAAWQVAEAVRRDAERERARAEAAVTIGERRLLEIDATTSALLGREASARRDSESSRSELDAAAQRVATAQSELDTILAKDAEERRELGGAERAASMSRVRVQELQDAARSGEREELEARLGLESLREQLLVELAGLGDLGFRHLARLGPTPAAAPAAAEASAAGGGGDLPEPAPDTTGTESSADVARLEAALAAVASHWTVEPPPAEAPTPGRLGALRRRFHELGAANPYAVEEHAALAARLETLDSQRRDLLAAVERTRALIAELDTLIASQFRATFGALELAFDARFRQLFGGGFARLSLTEPGDLASTGIEITARPPGKKPQALAMLSGGERALTAVALLFAMLEVRPVPFCVLDEVDAALDEANIGRFTDALRDLASQTQFIVITHNRGTIETADALYGVTVGDDSVSRVISLRLEEATALAGAVATADAPRADAPPIPRAPIIPAGLATEPPPGTPEPAALTTETGG